MNRRSSQKTNSFDNDGKLLYRPTRLVRRDLPFFQSRNELNVYLHGLKKHAGKLRQYDWFHVWLRQPTVKSCVLMLACWTVAILVFAGLYMAVDHAYSGTKCSMLSPTDTRTVMNYGGYFAFSLETTTTVGYGLPNGSNAFFEPCPALQTVMYLQMVWSMMFNAFLFAFFFARLAKSENRGAQVIFSKNAILARGPDTPHSPYNPWTLTVRVADIDLANPVVEAHVRLYAKIGSEMVEMRILAPNDVIGGRLLLSWPTTIVHQVDTHSPLHPLTTFDKPHIFELPHRGLNKRHCEAVAADHDRYHCPACGQAYGTLERLRRHVLYVTRYEINDQLPQNDPNITTHLSINRDLLNPPPEPTLEELKAWFPEEIIVAVEGIDSLASGTFMALQSYTLDDLVFDGQFADCLRFSKHDTVVDLSKFHSVVTSDMIATAETTERTDVPIEMTNAEPMTTQENTIDSQILTSESLRSQYAQSSRPSTYSMRELDNTSNIRQVRRSRQKSLFTEHFLQDPSHETVSSHHSM